MQDPRRCRNRTPKISWRWRQKRDVGRSWSTDPDRPDEERAADVLDLGELGVRADQGDLPTAELSSSLASFEVAQPISAVLEPQHGGMGDDVGASALLLTEVPPETVSVALVPMSAQSAEEFGSTVGDDCDAAASLPPFPTATGLGCHR